MKIKSNLKFLRKKYNLTYAKLEEQTGINYSKIQRIETGTTKDPQITDINKLAKFFGIALDDFVNEDLNNEHGHLVHVEGEKRECQRFIIN